MQNQITLILKSWNLLKPFHKWFYFNVILAFTLSGISVTLTFLGSKILNSIATHDTARVIELFITLFSLEIVWNIFSFIRSRNTSVYLDQKIAQYLQEHSFKKILNLTIEQHIEDHSAIKQQIVSRGESAIESVINVFVNDFIPNISYLIIALCTLFLHSFILGFSALSIGIILVVWVAKFTSYLRPLVQKNRDNWTEQGKTRTEAFTHLQLIKTLGKENYFITKYIEKRKKYADYDLLVALTNIKHKGKRSVFISSSENTIFLIAIILTLYKSLNVGGIFLVWNIIGRVFWSIAAISNGLRDLPLRALEAEKYFEATELSPLFSEDGAKDVTFNQDIRFTDVSFKYRSSDDLTLDRASFTIPHGKVTALVGSSGSGKSTITKILLRSYNYTEGSIQIGGTELRNINAHHLRNQVGYVEQHVDLLDDTIKENILLGVKESERNIKESTLKEVAHLARIDQFYHRLGDTKFDTVVGERGIKLSGGERQRVGIARAIIKDPDILIFDEATSSLDTENEKYVMDAIKEVSKGKTTIIIAHRLSTVKDADQIIVMDRGRVVGTGTHEELLAANSYYQTLVQHQLSS
jgi:ABC-type multidrug transport system fused ATPase/permease subunit